jgi:hypothetical protein
VFQAIEIKTKAVYRKIFENPRVAGSIPAPPQVLKKLTEM